MSTSARSPRQPLSGSGTVAMTPKREFSLSDIKSESAVLPNRFGFYAGVGFGKTSIAAYAPSPIFIETKGETGLETLIASGQLQPTPHFPEVQNWSDLLSAVRILRNQEHSFKTLVLDTGNGAEKLLHDYVCARDFDGDWTDKGFTGYQRGYDVALADWKLFLNSLDELRRDKGMTIFMLFHSRVKTFKNPSGSDYDRYTPEMHDKTWTVTKGWLDCILFGNFEVNVKTGRREVDATRKGKALDVAPRILCTNSDNPTYDAKNRLGLPDEIDMGETAEDGWNNFANAVRSARKPPVSVKGEKIAEVVDASA